jgi:hypothetical protein
MDGSCEHHVYQGLKSPEANGLLSHGRNIDARTSKAMTKEAIAKAEELSGCHQASCEIVRLESLGKARLNWTTSFACTALMRARIGTK